MHRALFLIIALLSLLGATAMAQNTPPSPVHTLTGDFCLHRAFHSRFLKADRDVLVWLPPGYDVNSRRRYPVLYLHDGQNLFDGATSFLPGKEWHVDETATALIAAHQIQPLIIVGISNAGGDRLTEYTPTKDSQGRGGTADLYGRMLVEELKPYIDTHYKTLTDANDTGLGGSSLGGLVSLYLGLKYPHVFGKLACLSTSAWWDNRVIVRDVQALPHKTSSHIWLDIGGAEDADSVDAVRNLRDALTAKGWKLGDDFQYGEAPGAIHNEDAWAQRVGPMLRFLFPQK